MPHIKGIELAKRVKDLQDRGEVNKDMRLVLISGDNIYREKFKRQLPIFNDVLQKPFTVLQLKEMLVAQDIIR
jgi:CheY-like chemotaxis protein